MGMATSLLKIEWRDQSCTKLEVVAKNKHSKNSVSFPSSLLAFHLQESGILERVSLAQIVLFWLFLRDSSPAYSL